MAFPFRRILCPIDFDHSAAEVLELGAPIAATNDGTVGIITTSDLLRALSESQFG